MRFSLKIVLALGFIAFATAQTTDASADAPKPTLEAVLASKAPVVVDDKTEGNDTVEAVLASKAPGLVDDITEGNGTVEAVISGGDGNVTKKESDDVAAPSVAPVDKPAKDDATTKKDTTTTTTTTTTSTTTRAPATTTKKPVPVPKKGDNDFKFIDPAEEARRAKELADKETEKAKETAEEKGDEAKDKAKEKLNTAAQVGDVRYAIVAALITLFATL